MCFRGAIAAEVRISIGARAADDAAAGHLATGLLAESDIVLIPAPDEQLLQVIPDVEVVVFPVPVRRESLIERLRPRKLQTLSLSGAEEQPTVGILKLAEHSRYAAQIGRCDGPELGAALNEHGGDVWAALEQLNLIAPGLREGPSDDELRELVEAEIAQRQPYYRDVENSFEAIALRICRWVCFCEPSSYG